MAFPLIELGGSGSDLHWAPANGFPFETYRPIIDALAPRYRSVAIPPRALWPGGGEPPDVHGSWEDLATDMVAGLAEHRLGPVVAIGHSFGGVASLVAAVRHRDRFRALILLDPTILPPERMSDFQAAKEGGWPEGHPMADRARERRDRFATPDEAFRYWRDKRLFADWSDEALGGYVAGMVPAAGGGYTLAWSAAWEAYYYESFYPLTWTDAERLDPTLPILVVGGATSDTFLPEARSRFQRVVPWATTEVVAGFGHLFPQAAPAPTIALVAGWLDRVLS